MDFSASKTGKTKTLLTLYPGVLGDKTAELQSAEFADEYIATKTGASTTKCYRHRLKRQGKGFNRMGRTGVSISFQQRAPFGVKPCELRESVPFINFRL